MKGRNCEAAVLLLDAECAPCSEFGKRIEDEGLTEGSILEIGSLHDERYKGYVGKFEPTLLHLDGDFARTTTGYRVGIDLVKLVGMRRAYRIAVLARNAMSDTKFDASRRSFLFKAAGAVAVLPVAAVLGAKTATATESEPSPLTALEAQAAYALLLASSEYAEAHRAAVADGVRHQSSSNLEAQESAFIGDTVGVFLGGERDGKRFVGLVLSYVDSQGNRADGYYMQAMVGATSKKVLVATHVDVTEVREPINESRTIDGSGVKQTTRNVVVPSGFVTSGLGNVNGVVHTTIEARINSPWHITRDGESVPVELIRIVPGANLIEVDEDAELATTTHALSGYEIRITQTDGTNTYSVKGILGPANLVTITDADLDSLAAGRDTTVHIGPQDEDTYNELKFDVGDEWNFADSEVSRFAINLRDGVITLFEEQNERLGDYEGYTLVVKQGSVTASGVLDGDNSFSDPALTNFVGGTDITATVRSTIATAYDASGQPLRQFAGTLRMKGKGHDVSVTDGVWSGTPQPPEAIARCETEICTVVRTYSCWTSLCVVITVIWGPLIGFTCFVVCAWTVAMTCWIQYGGPPPC